MDPALALTPATATAHPPSRVLLLPGWQNSGAGHWQTRWEALHGDVRVQQHDWHWPRRGDWMAQLEEAVLASPPPLRLAAHSLGCHLVAAWAAHSQHTARVSGALLVAPPDLLQPELPTPLLPWSPPIARRLPFPAHLVYSSDDPFCGVDASLALAGAWGARATNAGAAGHLNAASGLGDWAQGRRWLHGLDAFAHAVEHDVKDAVAHDVTHAGTHDITHAGSPAHEDSHHGRDRPAGTLT